MKTFARELLRWSVVAASGSYGLWQLVEAGRGFITRWEGGWLDALVLLLFPLVVAAPFLAIAYICLRRQYRKLFLVLGVIGCIVIFAELSALPEQLGMFQIMERHTRENHAFAFLGLPFALLLFFGPIYAAAWFYRLCWYLAYRGSPGHETMKRAKTRATRWLVWLGVLCSLLPTMVGMIVMFSRTIQSSSATPQPESVATLLDWIMGLTMIGVLLIFLGLVRRQPILEAREPTSSPETA